MLESLVDRHSKGLLDYRCGAVGNSALHWAAAKDHLGALRWLIERGAKLELRNNSGATALHSGAANGASACVDELLSRGADPEQADDTGRTAHDWAQVRAHKDVLAALRRHAGFPFEPLGGVRVRSPHSTLPQPMLSPSRGRVSPTTSTPQRTPRRQRSLRRAAAEDSPFVGLDGSPWRAISSPSSPATSASSGGSGNGGSNGEKRRRELAARSEGRRLVRAEAQLDDQVVSPLSNDAYRATSLEMALGVAAEATRKGMEETERLRAKVASLESQLSEAATSAREEGDTARAKLSECENQRSAEAKSHAAFRAQVEAERQAAIAARHEEEMANASKLQALQKAAEEAQETAATRVAAAQSASATAVAAAKAAATAAEKHAQESAEIAKAEATESEKRALETAAAATAKAEATRLLHTQAEESVAAWEAKNADLADRLVAAESEAAALRQRLIEADERVIALEAECLKAEEIASTAEEAAAALEAASNANQQGFEEAVARSADQARKEAEEAAAAAAVVAGEAAATRIADVESELDAAHTKISALERNFDAGAEAVAEAVARSADQARKEAEEAAAAAAVVAAEAAATRIADLESELDAAHTKIAALERNFDADATHSTEGVVRVEQLTAQHENDVALCEKLREQLEAAVAAAVEAEDELIRMRGLAASASDARDGVLAELDAARSDLRALEASSQGARRKSELEVKQYAEEAARERAEANKLRAEAAEQKKFQSRAEQAAVAAREETARAQQLAQAALAQTKAVQSHAQKARLKAESQLQTVSVSPSAVDVSSTTGAVGTPRAEVTEPGTKGNRNTLIEEVRRLRNQIITMEAANEISAAQEEEREETRERERVEERQAELIRAEERERERAGYEALLHELQSERAAAAETAVQAQEVQAATEEMVKRHTKLQQESQDEQERLRAELTALQVEVAANSKQQSEDQNLELVKLQSESSAQTALLSSTQVMEAQTQTSIEARDSTASRAELEQKVAQEVQAATEEMVKRHTKLQQESQDEQERLRAELTALQVEVAANSKQQLEVAANSKQQSEDAEAAIAAARSDETEAREQVQLMRKQLLEVQEQQCRSRSSAHVQTDETIGTRVQDELRTALERVAELERDAARAARKVPGPKPTRAAAFAPAETDHSSESVDAAFSSQRGAIVDGICATCGADVPDHPLVKLRAALRVATVQRKHSPSPRSDTSTGSRAVWPPRTPLTVALEESHTTNQGECGVHPLVRVRDALRAHDAATVEDTKTMLRELSFK